MIPYLVVFFIAIMATMLAQKNQKSKMLFLAYSSIAVLLPSALAGLRDDSVGTDTLNYPVLCYNIAEQSDSLMVTLTTSLSDPLFTLLIFLGYLKGSMAWSLFFVELFIVLFVYIAIYFSRDRLRMWKAYMIFMFLFFNLSLNLMRQTMALSVCLLTFVLWLNGKTKWGVLFFIVALLCHTTSIIFLLPLFLFYYIVVRKKKIPFYYILFMIFAVVLIKPISSFLMSIGLLSQHFSAYVEDDSSMFSNTNLLSQLILFIFLKQFCSFIKGRGIYMERYIVFSLLIAFSAVIFISASVISHWAYRVAFFFEILYVINIPYFLRQIKEKRVFMFERSFYVFIVLYWFIDVVINGSNATYPYTSVLLGII